MNRNGFANERSHIYAAANPIAIRGQHPSLQSPYANHKFGIRCALLHSAPRLAPNASRSHAAALSLPHCRPRHAPEAHCQYASPIPPPEVPQQACVAQHNSLGCTCHDDRQRRRFSRTHLVPDGPAYLQNALPECAQSANLRDKVAACPGAAALGASILDVSSSAD